MLQLDNINDFEWRRLVEEPQRPDQPFGRSNPHGIVRSLDGAASLGETSVERIMSEPPRKLAGRLSLTDFIATAVIVIAAVFVIALGFDFEVTETLEVLITGTLLVGVLGIAAGIAWAVGHLVERLTGEA